MDECAEDNGGCSHKCKNTEGSFVCSCPDPELNLAPNGRTCVGKETYYFDLLIKGNEWSVIIGRHERMKHTRYFYKLDKTLIR